MNKEGKIEIYRFLACVFIMIAHYVLYMHSELSIPFTVSFQFVEFFFIITGFFTARHVDVKWDENNKLSELLKYHIKKFMRFLPYTIPAILSVYCLESIDYIEAGDLTGMLINLKDIILEVSFLSVFRKGEAHLFIMWFLSAMFVTLPILMIFFATRKRIIKMVVSLTLPVLYYFFSPDYALQNTINQLLRAFFGMMLGGGIYYLSGIIKKKKMPRALQWIGTVIFAVAYIIPIALSYLNTYYKIIYIICFALWITLMMSDLTVLKPVHSKVLDFLGEISMPIFIWHIVVFKFVNRMGFLRNHLWLQFVSSIIIVLLVSILNTIITKQCKKYYKKK